MADAPVWPAHKWPYPTPGQGPLPGNKLPPLKLAKANKKTKLQGMYGSSFIVET